MANADAKSVKAYLAQVKKVLMNSLKEVQDQHTLSMKRLKQKISEARVKSAAMSVKKV